ncbi:hypothetical protein HPB48_014913 [Haemaphysalis longicornis]|uniref:Peptidase A2 domain-containing protein n=1 Tax=Haemaphysalis longicornis TaxID=44386 RepID=A0A9J6FRF8_HAELO|nr:hypothetical protein HPB48_014913 [Haemaphysalis longicornis]
MRYQIPALPMVQVHIDEIGDVTGLVDTGAERAVIHRPHAPDDVMKLLDTATATWPRGCALPGNGLTQRTNQMIKTRLALYLETHNSGEAKWDRHLLSPAYSVNTSFQSLMRKTPYEVIYGPFPKLDVAASLDTPVKTSRHVDRQLVCRNIRTEARRNAMDAGKPKKYSDR